MKVRKSPGNNTFENGGNWFSIHCAFVKASAILHLGLSPKQSVNRESEIVHHTKRWRRLLPILILGLTSVWACADRNSTNEQLELVPIIQDGDIIFQTSRSSQSQAIQLATHSRYSHMGIIFEEDGEFLVYEAVQPVKRTPLKEWINRGEEGHYVIKRLENANQMLTNAAITRMKQIGEEFLGKPYDVYFEWSDDKIYCSELVWKIYKEAIDVEIGQLEALSTFDLSNEMVQAKMKERYGGHIPMDEKVISPAAMFNSNDLITIEEN